MNQNTSQSPFGRILASLILCTVAGLPLGTQAQEWIVGGAVGTAKHHDYSVGGPVARRDDTDTAFRLFGGYLFSELHGVIGSFVDLGTPSYGGPAFGGFSDSLDADGIDVSYIAGFEPGDQERIRLFGTAGVLIWNQDVTYRDSTGRFDYGDGGTSFSIGIGTEINLDAAGTSAWGIHVGYQLFMDVGEAGNSGHENDRDTISVGIAYRFGRRN